MRDTLERVIQRIEAITFPPLGEGDELLSDYALGIVNRVAYQTCAAVLRTVVEEMCPPPVEEPRLRVVR